MGLTTHPKGLALTFQYDPLDVAMVKEEIGGARWLKTEKAWIIPWTSAAQAIGFCERRGWLVSDNVHRRLGRMTLDGDEAVARGHAMMARVGKELYPYQPQGIRFLAGHQIGILAWEMRTGKTIVSLSAHPEGAPLCVTAPASAVYQWAGEVEELRPDLKVHVTNRRSWRWPEPGEAIIGSWASLPKGVETAGGWVRAQEGLEYPITLLPDEVHKAKNPSAQRTRNMKSLVMAVRQQGGRIWPLTGTPVQNSPMELWHLLGTLGLQQAVFGNWNKFLELYDANRDHGVLSFGQPKPEVPERLRRVMHRFTFAEAAPHIDRPEPRFLPVDITMSAKKRKVLEESYASFREAMEASRPCPIEFAEARKELAALKAKHIKSVVQDLIDSGGGPVVVFCYHRAPIEEIGSWKNGECILGGIPKKEREARRLRFQNGETDVIGVTIRAGAEALTLSRAKSLVFIDLDWNPTTNAQAMARPLSVTQKHAPGVYCLVARGTVDEHQMQTLVAKTRMIEGTLNDRAAPPKRRNARKRFR